MIYFITNQESLFQNLNNDIIECDIEYMFNYFKNHNFIELDTETSGFDCYIDKLLFIQFGDPNNQFVVDLSTINILNFKSFLENSKYTFILQNAKFDLKFLYANYIVPKKVYDTYLVEKLLYLGDKLRGYSLDALCQRYLTITLDKSVRKDIAKEGSTTRVIKYSAYDVKYLSLIREKQLKLLEKENLIIAANFENAFVRVLAYIEFCGFYLNPIKWEKKLKQDFLKSKQALEKLNDWLLNSEFIEYQDNQLDLFSNEKKIKINWDSSKQVIQLFKKIGIKVVDKHGKESVDAKVLLPQIKDFDILPIYLEYKKLEKVTSTYGVSFLEQINSKTKRIHTNFNQLMDTSRLSSGGNGTVNFQNIPAVPEFKEEGKIYERECFEPQSNNNTFIVCDYSGQESVIFANKCLDDNLLTFYDSGGGDMHSYVAKLCYPEILKDVPLEEVKKVRKDLRQNAKAAGFALQFGGVGMTIAANLNISVSEGNAVEEAYYNAFPGVKKYFDEVCKKVEQTGEIIYNDKTFHKRKIDFFDEIVKLKKTFDKPGFWTEYRQEKLNNSDYFQSNLKPKVSYYFKKLGIMQRLAKNAPVQGTAAAMTKLALLAIFRQIETQDLFETVKIVNVIHDEIVLELPINISEKWSKIVKDAMENAGNYFCQRVPLKADPYIGKDWTH